MSGARLVRLAWGLCGLVVLAAMLIALSDSSTESRPLGGSVQPGGLAAFAELLRRSGYRVEVTDSIPASPIDDALIVAYFTAYSEQDDVNADSDPTHVAEAFVADHLRRGGRALLFPRVVDAQQDSVPLDLGANDVGGRRYVLFSRILPYVAPGMPVGDSRTGLILVHGAPYVTLEAVGAGVAARFESGDVATDACLGYSDDAEVLVSVVRRLAPPGGRIVFFDPTVDGGAAPTILDVLGPWSKGVLWQLAFLAFAVVVSLGVRFGLAETSRLRQDSSRELLDGVADYYARKRGGPAALASIAAEADRRARRAARLSADAPASRRDERLPPALVAALRAAEAAPANAKTDEAVRLARELDLRLAEFCGERDGPRPRA